MSTNKYDRVLYAEAVHQIDTKRTKYDRLLDEYMDRLIKHGSTLSSIKRALEALYDEDIDQVETILRMELNLE
jgi:hypothetical protein